MYEDAGAAPAAGEARDESVSAGAVADRLLEVARDTRAHALVIGARNSGADRDGVAAWVSRRLRTSTPCPVVVVE